MCAVGPPDLLTWGGMDRAQLNASAPGASEPNGTAQAGAAHSDYEEEILRYLWKEYLFPRQYEWVLIAGYIFVFVVALAGNILVCLAVWRNHHMRTVTNYFIVNLSLADLLVTAICLPVSLVVDITESWFFGQTLCKVIPYLQTVSVSVSVLTLSFIALDRWYAICHPLMFKSTARRARNSIVLIWLLSLAIMVPQAVVMETSSMIPELANRTLLLSVCEERWGGEVYPRIYHVCFFLVTYLAPLCLMFMAYFQIFRKLWSRQIPGASGAVSRKWVRGAGSGDAGGQALGVERPSGSTGLVARPGTAPSAEVKQLRARRKTAKMLLVVLLVFSLCYLPISVLNVLKRVSGVFDNAGDREAIYAWFTFSHWLVYANSAANPIIYNFLSGKFRGEFKAAFSCCFRGLRRCRGAEAHRLARTTSQKSLTNGSKSEPLSSRVSEHVVLSSVRAALS